MKLTLKSIPLAAVLLAIAASTSVAHAVTVGDFVRSTAQLIGVKPATAEGMRAAGYAVPVANLDAQLTEADVRRISSAIGVPFHTPTPQAMVSQRRAESVLAYLGSRAGSQQSARSTMGESSDVSDPRRRPRSRYPNPFRRHGKSPR